jgi:hypothetical protein
LFTYLQANEYNDGYDEAAKTKGYVSTKFELTGGRLNQRKNFPVQKRVQFFHMSSLKFGDGFVSSDRGFVSPFSFVLAAIYG